MQLCNWIFYFVEFESKEKEFSFITGSFLQALWVFGINIIFSTLAIVHLTYLGSMFDTDMDNMDPGEVRPYCYWHALDMSQLSSILGRYCWILPIKSE